MPLIINIIGLVFMGIYVGLLIGAQMHPNLRPHIRVVFAVFTLLGVVLLVMIANNLVVRDKLNERREILQSHGAVRPGPHQGPDPGNAPVER